MRGWKVLKSAFLTINKNLSRSQLMDSPIPLLWRENHFWEAFFWEPLLELEAGGWSSTGNLARPQLRLAWRQFVDWVSLGYVQQVFNDLPDMVDQILQNIHHVWRDVVERDGRVAAAGSSVCLAGGKCQQANIHHFEFFLPPQGICCMLRSHHLSSRSLMGPVEKTSGLKKSFLRVSRGMMCSLGFQIMNLARPPESRESPTLTFSLVRHWPKNIPMPTLQTQITRCIAVSSFLCTIHSLQSNCTVLVIPWLTLWNWTYDFWSSRLRHQLYQCAIGGYVI